MEKITSFEEAEKYIRLWAKPREIRIDTISIENDKYLLVNLKKNAVLSSGDVADLSIPFSYVLLMHGMGSLSVVVYLN